jgi:hypothetical protein
MFRVVAKTLVGICFGNMLISADAQTTVPELYNPFYQVRTGLAFTPKIAAAPAEFGGGLGLYYAVDGEGGGVCYLASADLSYIPSTQSVRQSFRGQIHGYAFFFGAQAAVEVGRVMNPEGSYKFLMPMVGIGLVYVFLNYGYEFSDQPELNHHYFSLSCYLPIWKFNHD